MTARTCNHVMPDGHTCNSPALRNQHLCYFHSQRHKKKIRIKHAPCPCFPRIPMNPSELPECPAVAAARNGVPVDEVTACYRRPN